jgi:tetratricopeptide (TPR) repeat protein
VKLHEGLVLFWLGQDAAAEAAWKDAEAVEPDSAAAVRAESLLHPEMPQGRPFVVPGAAVPADIARLAPLQQLDALEKRAKTRRTAQAWILYGVALQRAGRPVSAVRAFDRAVALDPDNVEAEVAAAVARFDKDDPAKTFSRLGPLSQSHPEAPVVRFHLGLCLLWLGDVEGARTQLENAVRDGGDTIWGQQAKLLLDRLDEATADTGATTG